ncbi:MAG: hypothetical protein KBG04_00470 [Bacteroidales bacterium]|jgi:hypothetical protein|nr:hypothetical protein [Bacteroidales bacterium]
MKLHNKFKFGILLTSISLLLSATACEDEVKREPSPETNPNSSNVYFASSNSASVVLGVSATNFEVIVAREKTAAALTVKLKTESIYGDLFTVPESVSFAAGEAQKSISIACGDLDLMKSYHFAIEIDPNETKPYVAQNVYPRIELNVLKEDFQPYANGLWSSLFFAPGNDYISWPLTLEYSEMSQTYRLKETWGYPGYDITFKWDGGATVTMGGTASGAYKIFKTGYVDPTYGMVSAYFGTCTYNTATKKFTFPITWRVSAGSFGLYPDYYQIQNLL